MAKLDEATTKALEEAAIEDILQELDSEVLEAHSPLTRRSDTSRRHKLI